MSDEQSAVWALKNAWNGVVAASAEIERLRPSVLALDESVIPDDGTLERYQEVALAQSIAVLALRGLVEQIQRKREKERELA